MVEEEGFTGARSGVSGRGGHGTRTRNPRTDQQEWSRQQWRILQTETRALPGARWSTQRAILPENRSPKSRGNYHFTSGIDVLGVGIIAMLQQPTIRHSRIRQQWMAGNRGCWTTDGRLTKGEGLREKEKTPARIKSIILTTDKMSHLRNLSNISSFRSARSIWSTGTSRPWVLARTPRTIFTTSRRSSVEPNQHHQEKNSTSTNGGFESPRFDSLSDKDSGQSWVIFHIIIAVGTSLVVYGVYDFSLLIPN